MADVVQHNERTLLDRVESFRLDSSFKLDPKQRVELGQFLTPAPTARLMASMFGHVGLASVRVLDAGAGVGTLTAAWVEDMCARPIRPRQVTVVAYEIDPTLVDYLEVTLEACRSRCEAAGIDFVADIRREDFIEAAVSSLEGSMFARDAGRFDYVIVNPPYRKIRSDSIHRALLRVIGVETSNLYSAFLSVIVRLLDDGGELVMITPRSFCNGPYFRPFRRSFLDTMSTRRVHIFDSRSSTFKDDEVLQENVIFHAVKGSDRSTPVIISSSPGSDQVSVVSRTINYNELVSPHDGDAFIHIVPDEKGARVSQQLQSLPSTLKTLGIQVSTGRVVDFRARTWLRPDPSPGTVPLIYPTHFREARVEWPKLAGKKPNAIVDCSDTSDLLVPNDYYVLVKRFSAKEERRRIVAATYDPSRIPTERVGFENHLNYFHVNGRGLDPRTAQGLTAFLNSTLVDAYFRHFNGHTQVNASDLRSLRYPTPAQLRALGSRIGKDWPDQEELDRIIERALVQGSTASRFA